MKKSATSLKKLLAVMLAVLMFSSCFAVAASAEAAVTIKATASGTSVTVTPTLPDGYAFDSYKYTVTPTVATATGAEKCSFTAVVGTEYTITCDYTISKGSDKVTNKATTTITVAKTKKAAPANLAAIELGTTSVKLTEYENAEYSMDNSTWVDSNEFTGLTEGIEYTFYARYKEDDSYLTSDASSVKVTPGMSASAVADDETCSIKVSAVFPETDEVSAVAVTPTGSPAPVAANEDKSTAGKYSCQIFNITGGVEYTVKITLKSGSTLEAKAMVKAKAAAPKTPSLKARTSTTITLNTIANAEYTCVEHGVALTDAKWVKSAAFKDLKAGVIYDFYAKYPATETTRESDPSPVFAVATLNAAPVKTVKKVVVDKVTETTVTLVAVKGYEYSKDSGKTWQTSNEFTGLTANTTYSFVQRYKVDETTTELCKTSAVNSVKTNSAAAYIIDQTSIPEYKIETENGKVTVTATPAKKATTDNQWGDISFIPAKIEIYDSEKTLVASEKFTTSDKKTYTATYTIEEKGTYTVKVVYDKYEYQGSAGDISMGTAYSKITKTVTVQAQPLYYFNLFLNFLGSTLPNLIIKLLDALRKIQLPTTTTGI